MIPGKHSDTRIKPLPLTNGHGRYTTVTRYTRTGAALVSSVRWGMAVTNFITVINLCCTVTVSLPKPKRLHNGRFTIHLLPKPPCGGFRSKTATWIQKHNSLKYPLGLLESSIYYIIYSNSFRGGGDGRGCRNTYKMSQGHD
jgi:hypothetical protein